MTTWSSSTAITTVRGTWWRSTAIAENSVGRSIAPTTFAATSRRSFARWMERPKWSSAAASRSLVYNPLTGKPYWDIRGPTEQFVASVVTDDKMPLPDGRLSGTSS